jgi:signal transduction histidine kinase
MDWPTIIASALIFFGATLMLANIFSHHNMMQIIRTHCDQQTEPTKRLILAHMVFMVFFFLAYLVILYLFFQKIDFASSILIAAIFFFGAVFVFMGITIQKKLFLSLQQNNQKLIKNNNELIDEQENLIELNQLLEAEIEDRLKAQKLDKIKSDFLSLVSHELRTPLTSIYGFTKLIKKDFSAINNKNGNLEKIANKKQRLNSNLDIICTECSRLTRLINNVLNLAKIESEEVVWNNQVVELHDLIKTAVSAVEGLFIEKTSISFELDLPNNLPKILIDVDLFTQVLINLINNAVKFTKSGTISLKAMIECGKIKIIVTDDGCGIPKDNLTNIFNKFYTINKGDTLNCGQMGTGLGLPICKEIITHYSGKIWAESSENNGSSFFILLPESLIVE